ncbi:hypothetical protein MSG28_014598 [Choristoneura fumiferana]|uniref:Uncharacterized protein n=1 Tax=Choristoneura fumiferana TaxID=7141 RepID=A0ACC0JS42_CHOFU|nr:hypothetical protein MSG28_014598 [Choristoneura fumiferana]
MALKFTFLLSVVLACVAAQSTSYRVCVSSSSTSQCQSLDRDDSQAFCTSVESRVDCALQLARGTVDIGYFTEEELLVLADLQSYSSIWTKYIPTSFRSTSAISLTVMFLHIPTTSVPAFGEYLIACLP